MCEFDNELQLSRSRGNVTLQSSMYIYAAEFIEPEHVDMCRQQSREEKGEVCILLDL